MHLRTRSPWWLTVAAYVAPNSLGANEIPALIASVHQALTAASGGTVEEPAGELKPAVPVKKSVTPDAIFCLEDGKSFKSLNRHLATKYGMTPADYRAKWGLPHDYPMVAPNYAAVRSEMAKGMGLGQLRWKPEPIPVPKAKRGWPRKVASSA